MAKLIKLAKMAGVMHEADHAYSIQSTWWLHRLATDVPLIHSLLSICPVLLPITSNCRIFSFILWSGLSYVRALTICLLLVYFVSAAGCHCIDSPDRSGISFLSGFANLNLVPRATCDPAQDQPPSQGFVRSSAIKRLEPQTNPFEAPPRSWQICRHFEFIIYFD